VRLFAQRASVIEEAAAVHQELLALAREQKPTTDPIKELEAELVLQMRDLSRQCRLGDMKLLRGGGNGADLGHGDEGAHVTQVHEIPSCRIGIDT
jgi:hypothetical protein